MRKRRLLISTNALTNEPSFEFSGREVLHEDVRLPWHDPSNSALRQDSLPVVTELHSLPPLYPMHFSSWWLASWEARSPHLELWYLRCPKGPPHRLNLCPWLGSPAEATTVPQQNNTVSCFEKTVHKIILTLEATQKPQLTLLIWSRE